MATAKEIAKYCRDKGFIKQAKTSVSAFSDFSVFVDGNLEELEKQAKKDGLDFYLIHGEMPKKNIKEPKDSE